jgi:putative tryptophan/tyrosine transport system substrate-binding protein
VERYNHAFLNALRDEGYVHGVTAVIDIRKTYENFESGHGLAEELVALDPAVIYAVPGSLAKHVSDAVHKSGKKIPVVVLTYDPVAEGLVASAAHPGANITGVAGAPDPAFVTKPLQVLKETVPRISHVMYMEDWTWGPGRSFTLKAKAALESAGRQMGIGVTSVEIRGAHDIQDAFAAAVRERVDGIILTASPLALTYRGLIISLAAKYRLPAIYGDELFAHEGGFISYWTSIVAMHVDAARLIGRILRGAKAQDLPVEYPMRFRLLVNLRTAKALGLVIPQSVLLQADELIR